MKHMVPVNSVYCSIHALLVPKLQFVMGTPEREQRIVMNFAILIRNISCSFQHSLVVHSLSGNGNIIVTMQ